ncbi:40821_t:CDS:2, partial [Gigaspora margarita]
KEYDYAPTPDTEIDNVGTNMNNMEEQTQNDLVTPEMQLLGVLDTEDKLVAQHDNSGESTTPIYILITLKTANKATQPGDTEWLHSEEFTPVVNKKLAASKKNKKIEKSKVTRS